MADGKIPVEKFDGTDFDFWKMQIEDYLYGKELHLPLGDKPEDMKDDEWKLLDMKAMSAIRLSLSRNVAHHTVKATTTKGLLAILFALYEKPSAVNKVHLMMRLFNFRMKEDTQVSKHLNEFNMTIAQLQSVEIDFDDEVFLEVLRSVYQWNDIRRCSGPRIELKGTKNEAETSLHYKDEAEQSKELSKSSKLT